MEVHVKHVMSRIVSGAITLVNVYDVHQDTHWWATSHANNVAATADHAILHLSTNVIQPATQHPTCQTINVTNAHNNASHACQHKFVRHASKDSYWETTHA